MAFILQFYWLLLSLAFFALIYLINVNHQLHRVPEEALRWSPKRWTKEDIIRAAEEEKSNPTSTKDSAPPQTGRRYTVVGGNGLVGGWLILQLLARGENPMAIRIIDNRVASRADLLISPGNKVPFLSADIRSPESTLAAFSTPWPSKDIENLPLTVFHLAAVIRHYERHPRQFHLSAGVNVDGTRNVLQAAKAVGAKLFVATSSASLCIRTTNLFKVIPFFHPYPKDFCQFHTDGDENLPQNHYDFFSNYAVSKLEAERLVRDADDKETGFRTGCLRPGNGVYGGGGDYLSDGFSSRNISPVWIDNTIQSFTYAENAALAHLNYEKCLIDLETGNPNQPDIGGETFIITDPNPPITYGDFNLSINLLSHGRCKFLSVSPVLMYFIAYLIERYYLLQTVYIPAYLPFLKSYIPRISGDAVSLQPSVFSLTSVNLYFDDSRARKDPRDGGLGYKAPFTTLKAMCKTGIAFEKARQEGGYLMRGWGDDRGS